MWTSSKLRSGLGTAIVAGMAVGCAGQQSHYNPFIVPRDRIAGSVKTIALAPVAAPGELGDVDPGRGKFDSLLTAQLQAAGYTVVASQESATIWQRVTDSLGGFFDPTTGQRDSVKFSLARAAAMHELQERFQADAWLHPHIVFAPAKFDAGTASWDGATQTYQSFGKKLLAALFGGETYGRAPALSVHVILEDMHGNNLYANQGGLQLFEVPSGRDFARIPPRELYADAVRNAEAVRLALAPLVARTPGGGTPR